MKHVLLSTTLGSVLWVLYIMLNIEEPDMSIGLILTPFVAGFLFVASLITSLLIKRIPVLANKFYIIYLVPIALFLLIGIV